LLAPVRASPSLVRAAHQYPRERVFEDVGFSIERTGPIYCRVVGLVPHQPLIAVWRVDVGLGVEVDVLAGAEPVRYTGPPTDRDRRWRNWVFGVPAANVRESTLQLSISAYRYGGFALFQARFYQPF